MNSVNLVGRLTADPELKQTPNGHNVCSFSIAVNKYVNGENKAIFINIVAWRGTAETVARYFRKGQNIGISGSIDTRTYQDKDTGKNRTAFDVIAERVFFVESKNSTSAKPQEKPSTPTYSNPTISFEEDLNDFSAIASDDGDLPF